MDGNISSPTENRQPLFHSSRDDHDSVIMRLCALRIKITLWALFVVVAIVGLSYALVMIKPSNAEEAHDAPISENHPKTSSHVFNTTLRNGLMTKPKHNSQFATHVFNTTFRNGLITKPKHTFMFKTLYVLSLLQKTDNSSLTLIPESSVVNPNNGVNKSSSYGESLQDKGKCMLGMRQEKLCAMSVTDYKQKFNCSKLLPSIDNIFFLETSCAADQISGTPENTTMALSEKQACSIYSAAHYNPSRKVILLFTCPLPMAFKWTVQWKILFDLPNFFFGHVDVKDLYANTSLFEFYHGPLSLSKYPIAHQADLLRMFLSYLYGGTYMDTDIISFKSLDDLGVNYVIAEGKGIQTDQVFIVNGIWNFEPYHHILKEFMIDGMLHYNPNGWSTIGPKQITDTVKHRCNVSDYFDPALVMYLPSCNIRILPQYTFFSVPWWESEFFYESKFWPEVEKMTNGSYGVHYWNSRGGKYTLSIGSKEPIIKFAERHCPPVYYNAGPTLS